MPPDQTWRDGAAADHTERVARVEARARRVETPCGDGTMIWRLFGAGRPLLLLHGGYGSWTHWLKNIESLSETYTVIAPDIPGLGESATPPQPWTAESVAAIMVAGLDRVVPPPTQIALAGFSFGAVMAGHLAAQMGARASCVFMIGAAGLGLPRPPLANLTRVEPGMSSTQILAIQRGNLVKLMFGDSDLVDDFAVYLQNENTRRGRFDSRSIAFSDTLLHALPQASARIGAIWGEKDVTCVPYIEQKCGVLRQIQPGATCEVIAGAGHWTQWEQPAAVEARLRTFIEGRL